MVYIKEATEPPAWCSVTYQSVILSFTAAISKRGYKISYMSSKPLNVDTVVRQPLTTFTVSIQIYFTDKLVLFKEELLPFWG